LNQARLNTYVLFVETATRINNTKGRIGIIVPSGIATDDICKKLFSFLVRESRIVSLFDFENRERLFPEVDSRYKFSLLTLRGSGSGNPASFAFFLQDANDLRLADRFYKLTSNDFQLLSPISGLCPTFRSSRDREIVLRIYERMRPLILQQESNFDWSKSDFLIMFRSDDSSHLYKSVDEIGARQPPPSSLPQMVINDSTYLPVWESKLFHQFDHRFASFANTTKKEKKKGNAIELRHHEKNDAWIAIPRYWTVAEAVQRSLKTRNWTRLWVAGYRDITNATNERTAIATILPLGGAAQPLNLFLPESSVHACLWLGAMNSFALDYVARQRIGGVHLNITTCRQLPIVGPKSISDDQRRFIINRVLELIYTSPALEPFAKDCGCFGPPFRWNEERRFLLRCELDGVYFHLYDINQDDADYIMETFPIVRRKDEQKYGEYRTKRVILECYDAMAEAMKTGRPYQTILDPPPADPRVAHKLTE
ncbi:MAG: class I SAM-dependent DNA methyltransferase, partial [Deltaproteobacteria bacterium]|nr:class I SAM-dependent DNA methyltransferase [Deltaproteobacteria bacterium]